LTITRASRTLIPENRKRKRWSWSGYYDKTARGAAWGTLREAFRLFEIKPIAPSERFAIDLGCGAGRDTLYLLRHGWKVLAVDNQREAIRRVRSRARTTDRHRLRTRVVSFEQAYLPKCDLVNASYSLPFCSPKHFKSLWCEIVASIRPGGRFAGHFFGTNDEWAILSDMTFHSRKQAKSLLRNFKIEIFHEKEWEGKTSSGRRKHWHVISIVARKL